MGLTDKQQAVVMFLVFVLPAFATWAAGGMPTDRVTVGILVSDFIAGCIVALKELLGGTAPTPAPQEAT